MSGSSGEIHVLHVEDDRAFAEMTAEFLERADDQLTVRVAIDADEGLAVLDEQAIDCIVSDYDLPGMDGLEFLETVRDDHPGLPFILYTGKGSEEVASDAISAGVTDYLQKGSGTSQYEVLANRIVNAVEAARASRARQETEAWASTLLEHSSDYVLVVDRNAVVSYASPSIERVMGYSPDDVEGASAFEFVLPDDLELAADAFAETLDHQGEEVTVEFRARHADGSVRWVEARGRNLFDDPTVDGLLVNARDITERKERDRELETLRDRMEFVFEATASHVWTADVETGATEAYGDPEPLYGLSAEEIQHTETFYEAVHPDDRPRVRQAYEAVWSGDRDHFDIEFRTNPANGEVRWLHSQARLREEHDTERLVGLTTDVTERKRREQQLARQKDRLDEFSSVVSHDLRNPLNVAQGRLELAQAERASEHLDPIAESLDRMEALIDDLLELARLGNSVTSREPVDLGPVVQGCWATVETADATLVADVDRTIRADESRLRQVFENLFRNAVEHAGEGVTVTVGDLPDGFFVEDDGPGIPEGDREDVFEAGYSTSDGGTGFGLNIVAEVVESHGWEVRVTDGPAGGARFEITGVDIVD